MSLLFSYDPAKARTNLRKHGVSFEDAKTVFLDPLAITVPYHAHSDEESREITLGYSERTGFCLWCILKKSMAKSGSSAPEKPMPTSVASTRMPKPATRMVRRRIDFSKGTVGKYYEATMASRNLTCSTPTCSTPSPTRTLSTPPSAP